MTPRPENPSYWVESTSDTVHPPLDRDLDIDIAVVGAGMVGITTAYLLRDAGLEVALIEADGMARGVTGYTTAKVTSGHSTIYQSLASKHGDDAARTYAQANEAAIDRVATWVEELSIECDFERKPNYVYCESPSDVSQIEMEVEAARAAGLPVSFVTESSLPFPIAGAVRQEDQAQFHPRKYLLALVDRFVSNGGLVFGDTRVTGVKEAEVCTVDTERGRSVRARRVVLATHYPILDRGLFFARVHPKRSYCVAGPIDASTDPGGMYISTEPSHSIRTTPSPEGPLLIVGGAGHAVGEDTDTGEKYAYLERWAAERFGLTDIRYRWSTQDGSTVDSLPYIGTQIGRAHV